MNNIQTGLAAIVMFCRTALLSAMVIGRVGTGTALADAACAGPGNEPVVLAAMEGWRTLTAQSGEQLTPAGIADFAALSRQSSEQGPGDDAVKVLEQAVGDLLGKPLRFTYVSDRPDRHGRRPVLLFAGGNLVQSELVAGGLAIAYPSGDTLPCANRLLAAERLARAGKNGFWAAADGWIAAPLPDAFAGRMQKFTIMQGRIVSVGTRKNRSYLNFGGRWASDVTVEVPAGSREKLGGTEALEELAHRQVRIRGFPVEKSGPMIEVRQSWQIELVR